jgi:tetratricopeptide (TPR) repeat protein
MTFPVGLFRTAPLLLVGLVLSGCLPSGPKDEEKEQFFLAGKSRVNSMDFRGAIESFEKAVEVNPKSAPAHFELGWLYDQKEADPAAAIYHYERYLKLAPNSGKEEMIKTRILACKQQLAQTVSLGPVTEKQQRELEQLVEENRRLREDLEKWRAFATRLQNANNQARPASPPPPHGVQPSAPGELALGSASLSNSASSSRLPTAAATTLRTHIVKAGETPTIIARKYGVRVEALMTANPKLDARHLHVGQALAIPAP